MNDPQQPLPPPTGRPHPQSDFGETAGRTSLHARRDPLAAPSRQRERLESVNLENCLHSGDFGAALAASGWPRFAASRLEIFQINLGKLCNMVCRHCHVDAGPDRTDAMMDRDVAEACLRAMDRSEVHTVDLTGGAPELNPNFRFLVDEAAARGKHIIDRCNLTVLLLPNQRDLPKFLADRNVEVVCSLPHVRQRNTDSQRGEGTYEQSIKALKILNEYGYGQGDSGRCLTLVANPTGAFLPGDQASMELEWKGSLAQNHGVRFDRLFALNNMPVARFLDWLQSSGNLQAYLELLVNSFNPGSIEGLMCRNTISVSWAGYVYDCDFNQMLELGVANGHNRTLHVHDFDPETWATRQIVTGRHCFGCTAGAGSSCGGSLVE